MKHLSPPGTQVVGLTSFDDARRAMLESPPDAAVVSIASAHLPWRAFRDLCARQRPPVPVLYESCVFSSAEEAGLAADGAEARFLHTPAPMGELSKALAALLDAARASGERRARPVVAAQTSPFSPAT